MKNKANFTPATPLNVRSQRKPKLPKKSLAGGVFLAAASLALLTNEVTAATLTWDSNTSTNGAQDGGGTWYAATSGANTGATANNFWKGSAPDVATTNNATTDIAWFGNGGTLASVATVNVATQSISGLIFGTTVTNGYLLTNGAASVLTIGSSGITVNSGALATTVGSGNLSLTLGAAQTWTNNSASTLTIGGGCFQQHLRIDHCRNRKHHDQRSHWQWLRCGDYEWLGHPDACRG